MSEIVSEELNRKKNNLNGSSFNVEEKKSEIMEDINMPNYKEDIDFVFKQNPELIKSIQDVLLSKLSFSDKKELFSLIRSSLFNKIRGSQAYKKHN